MANNPSFKTQSKAAQHRSNVAMLGDLGSLQAGYQLANFTAVEDVVGNFIKRVKTNINDADIVVTGEISDIRIAIEGNDINIYGNPWLLYQDRGVNGAYKKLYNTPHSYSDKRPPASVFYEWAKKKVLASRNNANFFEPVSDFAGKEDEEIEALSYAIREKIYQEGFEGTKIFAKEIPQLIEDIKKEIPNFMTSQIIQQINAQHNAQLFTGKK